MNKHKFRLLRYFSLTSLVVFLVGTVLLGQLYHQAILGELIELGENKNVALAQAFANSQWPEFASFMNAASVLEPHILRVHPEIQHIHRSILTQMEGLGVVKVKIYNRDGLTVFSTDKWQIGEDQRENPAFRAARSGQITSTLTHRDTFYAFDRVIKNRRLISTYLPLRQTPQAREIEGVFELYSDVTPLFQRIQRTERLLFGGIIAILALLYLGLFLIVRRADRLISRQSADLRKLSQAVEQSVNTIVITDLDGNPQYMNPCFTETTGYTFQDALEQKLRLLGANDQDDRQYQELWETISSGNAWQGEFQNRRKNGTLYWEQAAISPIYDENGQMTHFLAVKEDISDKKRAEEVLQDSRRQVEAALRREKERRRLSDTLRRVARIVGSTLDQERVVDLILGQLEQVIMYHRATVSILEGNTLTLIAGRDKMGGEIDVFSFPADKYPINALVLTEKRPVLIPDVIHDERWHESNSMRGIRSFIVAPLLVQDQPIGTLAVGNLDSISYTDEDAQTVFAFATQVAMAIRNAQLHAEVRNRMEQELQMAQQIQKSLLAFDVPNIPGLDIAGVSQPAREVGGDFYNFSVFNERHLGIAVGDVSGKGMQAALMMSLSFGLLANEVRHSMTPAALMTAMNKELRAHTQHSKMNTALGYITIDKSDMNGNGQWHVRAANAGLIAPLVRHRNGEVEWVDVVGLPLGTVEGLTYTELEFPVFPGDLVLLTTDGIIEAMNEKGEMYGFIRLAKSIEAANYANAQTLLSDVMEKVKVFVGKAEVHDDVTMVAIMVKSS